MAKVLLGFMGVGKSSVAPYLDGRFVDMDQVIEEKIGMTIADFLQKKVKQPFVRLSLRLWRNSFKREMTSSSLLEVVSL